MLERPTLSDEQIAAALQAGYALDVHRLEFLPLGNDSSAWAFAVHAQDQAPYFLKLRHGITDFTGLVVPRFLRDVGIDAVVAPLPSTTGALYYALADLNPHAHTSPPEEEFALILYPFVHGETGMERGLTPGQWRMLGRLMQRIHATAALPNLPSGLPFESFRPRWRNMVLHLDRLVAGEDEAPAARVRNDAVGNDAVGREFAAYWRSRRDEILAIVAHTEALGTRLHSQADPADWALCHADIHTANVLVDDAGALHIVDWDGALLAPRERDFMFVAGGEVDPAHMSTDARRFFMGYGAAPIDPWALAYYRYEWVVQELGDYGERILLMPELGEESRAYALAEFQQLFAPGDVVEEAYAANRHLA